MGPSRLKTITIIQQQQKKNTHRWVGLATKHTYNNKKYVNRMQILAKACTSQVSQRTSKSYNKTIRFVKFPMCCCGFDPNLGSDLAQNDQNHLRFEKPMSWHEITNHVLCYKYANHWKGLHFGCYQIMLIILIKPLVFRMFDLCWWCWTKIRNQLAENK